MSRFENKTVKEIADETNLTIKGVEYHITKALKALRINLKDYLPLFYFFLNFFIFPLGDLAHSVVFIIENKLTDIHGAITTTVHKR